MMSALPGPDAAKRSRFVMDNLSVTVLMMDQQGRILDCNRSNWTGHPLPEPRCGELVADYRQRILAQGFCRVSGHDENVITVEHSGKETHFLLAEKSVSGGDGSLGYLLEIFEITSVFKRWRLVEETANMDLLTGLYNRNAYINKILTSVKQENMPLLVIVGDGNDLKHVNNTLGHVIGDRMLKAAADVIKSAMPKGAFAARIGGDEFVLLIEQGSEEAAQEFFAGVDAACAALVREPFGALSISWGYALMTSVEQSYNEVFSVADEMMYEQKRANFRFSGSGFIPEDHSVGRKVPQDF